MLGVIFDMDGVLVDSNAAHFEAFKKLGEQIGVPFTRELLQRTVGMHNNQIFPIWLGAGIAQSEITRLAGEKEQIYRSIARGTLREIPSARVLVKRLYDEGIPLAVGSSGPRENVELAIETLGLAPFFKVRVTGSDVTHGKPNPEIFLKAAEKLGLRPSDCVVIEDAPQGVRAALAAGMRVIAVTTTCPASELSAATRVVSSLDEIGSKFFP